MKAVFDDDARRGIVLWQVPSTLQSQTKRLEAEIDKRRYGLRAITAAPVGHTYPVTELGLIIAHGNIANSAYESLCFSHDYRIGDRCPRVPCRDMAADPFLSHAIEVGVWQSRRHIRDSFVASERLYTLSIIESEGPKK